MKKVLVGLMICTSLLAFGQKTSEDFQKTFTAALKVNDLVELKQITSDWRNELPQDPEGYIGRFNYYILEASNIDILEEQATGLLTSRREELYIDSALTILDQGLSLHPLRLDMHMGYIYVLGQHKRWQDFTPRILTLLERAKLNDFQGWLWGLDRPVGGDAKIFIIESISDYQSMLYSEFTTERLVEIRQIAIVILSIKEDHIDQLNMMALSYSETGDPKKGYKWIRRALELSPDTPELQDNYKRILLSAFKKKDARKEVKRWRQSASGDLFNYLNKLYIEI